MVYIKKRINLYMSAITHILMETFSYRRKYLHYIYSFVNLFIQIQEEKDSCCHKHKKNSHISHKFLALVPRECL